MLNELKVQRDIIALEAFNISSPSQLLSGFFPGISNKLSALSKLFKADEKPVKLTGNQKEFLKKLETLNYMDISSLSIVNTMGLNDRLTNFSRNLDLLSEKLTHLSDEVLNPFSQYVASLISNAQHKFDTSNNFLIFEQYGKEVNSLFSDLNKQITAHPITKPTIGDLVERNSDWNEIFVSLNKTNEQLNSVDRNALEKKIKEIAAYLELIIKRVKDKQLQDISPQVVRSLAEGAYQSAQLLEVYSIVYFHTLATNTLVDSVMSKITKL